MHSDRFFLVKKWETQVITSERSEGSSYYPSYMGRFVDIQTSLNPLKKSEKIEMIFITILEIAESFKRWTDPSRP